MKVRIYNNIQCSIFNIQYLTLTLGFTLATLFFVAPSCFAVDLPKTAKLLPPQTIVLIDIDDYSRLRQQFDKTSLYRFYKDHEMSAFVEHAKTQWQKSIKEMDENNMFRAMLEPDVEPRGRLALAVVPQSQAADSNDFPVVIITQWGDNINKIKEAMARAVEKNTEMGGHSEPTQDFRGVTIESAVDEGGTQFGYCCIDDVFLTSTDIEHLKFVISRLKGASTPALADDPDYNNTINAVGPDNALCLYVNIKQVIKMAVAEDTKGQVRTSLANLGLDNVSSFGASVELGAEPLRPYIVRALLKVNGSKKGLCKIFDSGPAPLRVPRFVPADAYRLNVVNLDIKKTYSELVSVLTAFGPAAAAPLYSPLVPASPDGRPAVMLKEDIIDYLTDQVVISQSLKKPFSDNLFPSEYIIAIATSNRSALEKSLAAWHSSKIAPDNPEAKRELLGHTLYLFKSSSLPFFKGPGGTQPLADEDSAPPIEFPVLAFTVTDTHLLFGSESSVEKAIRTLRSGESLSDAPWFRRARAALPSRAGMFSLEDTKSGIEFLWWLMEKSEKDRGAAGLAAPTASYLVSDFDLDFSLLPDFEKVGKYFGLTVSHIISRPDGFYMELKGLDQPN